MTGTPVCNFLTKASVANLFLINFCYLGTIFALVGIYCTYWITKATYYSTYNCILFSSFFCYIVGFMIWSSVIYIYSKEPIFQSNLTGEFKFGCWFYLGGALLQLFGYIQGRCWTSRLEETSRIIELLEGTEAYQQSPPKESNMSSSTSSLDRLLLGNRPSDDRRFTL